MTLFHFCRSVLNRLGEIQVSTIVSMVISFAMTVKWGWLLHHAQNVNKLSVAEQLILRIIWMNYWNNISSKLKKSERRYFVMAFLQIKVLTQQKPRRQFWTQTAFGVYMQSLSHAISKNRAIVCTNSIATSK